jgi:hypothetical protein
MKFNVWMAPLLVMLLSTLCMGADIYIWTDEKGVKHIEDRPPGTLADKELRVEKYTYSEGTPSATKSENAEKSLQRKPELNEAEPKQASGKSEDPEKQAREKAAREQRDKEIEKARQDYEDALKSEALNRATYRKVTSERKRHIWRDSLRQVEETKSRLEELENPQ